MAERFDEGLELTPQELAKHLRQPDGEEGKAVGMRMNKGNQHICINTYKVLSPKDGHHILEVGMGNGFFVKDLLSMADKITYVGADFSHTMVEEAKLLNQEFIAQGLVHFEQASIEQLPFEDNTFDLISTTNTLYFWPQPNDNARELLRVLKPGGKLLIAYRTKDCLNQIKLTEYGFEKYHPVDVEKLLDQAGYCDITTQRISEPDIEFFNGVAVSVEGIFTSGIK